MDDFYFKDSVKNDLAGNYVCLLSFLALHCLPETIIQQRKYPYEKYEDFYFSNENNFPGISLRTFGSGGMHYRPVIAYKNNGWGPFSWPSFKILDLVDCDDKEKGMWETYVPVHHLMNWNIVKK